MAHFHEKVLITDDDTTFRRVLSSTLHSLDFDVSEAPDGEHALTEIQRRRFDVVLLDLSMPGMGGVAACREMRRLVPKLGIIMLSVRDDEGDKVEALEAGADDYVTKPFSVRELVARLKAATRRATESAPETAQPIIIGDIALDPERRTVFKGRKPIHLTPTEFELLHYLMAHAGSPITHQKLLSAVGHGFELEYLRTFIKQLRQKLEDSPGAPEYVLREPGVGYRFRGN